MDSIRQFRQLHSRCPGHPEHGHTSGVETTTGPLGQGIGNSVGMAIASRWLAARYNRPGFDLFDFNVYALCSDGDLMEGLGGEAASLAGHLKLSNLCWIYDDNHITIEGKTSLSFSEDVATRFVGYGWNVVKLDDANDLDGLRKAIKTFQHTADRPTLIKVRSVIGFGAPHKANSHDAHGAPLGEEEIRLTKAAYGWPENEKFLVPPEVPALFREGIGARGQKLHAEWNARFAKYQEKYPELAAELEMIERRELPKGWDSAIESFPADAKGMASRVSSGKVLNQAAKNIPWLLGGSADLAPSTNTLLKFERRRRLRGRPVCRAKLPLRHPRARHGGAVQRHESLRSAGLRGHVLRLHRLHAPLDPAGRHHGPARVLCLHPRFDRRGRGWPHASADRASGGAAGDPQLAGDPALRCQRGGRGVPGDPAAEGSAGGAGADASEPAHARPREIRFRGRTRSAAATCWPTPPTAGRT